MQYISGMQALNLKCSLETCGDWHQSAISWKHLNLKESNGSLLGDYGIEQSSCVPEHNGIFYTANHIRALLDLIEDCNFGLAQGMCNDFIDNDRYNHEIFTKILYFQNLNHWDAINQFMGKEYKMKWLNFASKNRLKILRKTDNIKLANLNTINNMGVYELNRFAQKKAVEYSTKDRISDLYYIVFICNNYMEKLDKSTKNIIRDCLMGKGIEQFDYLVATHTKLRIDMSEFASNYLNMYKRLSILE